MGVEVVESELPHVLVETGIEEETSFPDEKENGKMNQDVVELNVPIQFGSHGTNEPVKVEVKKVPEANFPKDAVDEWPAPKRIHHIYMVKYRSYEDPKLKVKLDQADKELQKKNQARFQITEKLRALRADRSQIIGQIMSLVDETKGFRTIMDGKRKEMEPLQQALGKLRDTRNTGREKGVGICSSEEELNYLIKSLQYRIQHESIPLTEEKQLLREIKLLEGTREKVIAKVAMRAEIEDSLGEKQVIQDQVKLMGVDLDGVKKEQQVVRSKLKQLDEEKLILEKKIDALQEELAVVTEKKNKTYENILELRKQREAGNSIFYKNRTHVNEARDLAAKKDIDKLKKIATEKVENFFSLWYKDTAFKADYYEKRIFPSLDIRQLSRDGTMRNPYEKPVLHEAPAPPEPEIVPKTNVKQPISIPHDNTPAVEKVQKEKISKPKKEENDNITEDGEEGIFVLEKPRKDPPKGNEIDVAKLKETKREEEMAKAKQALERKKKLAEKTAAKATIKAQKEAEKKLKEREKKAKKKTGASAPTSEPEEPTESAAEVSEPEKTEENVEVSPVPSKNKDRKVNTVRYRNRSKGSKSLSKIILKRKKSTNYWVWVGLPALLVLILLAIGFYYYLL